MKHYDFVLLAIYTFQNNVIFKGVRYFISQPGKICSDSDDDFVNSYTECQKASSYAITGLEQRKGVRNETLVFHPQGCMYYFNTKQIVFNYDRNGGMRNNGSVQVCKTGMSKND